MRDFLLPRAITKIEVHEAHLSLPNGKSPGPDSFNAEFYHFFWVDIGDTLFAAVQFFPIMLACLLQGIKYLLPRLISREQTGFVTGHSPFDNIITLQEVAHSLNKDFRQIPPPLGC